ncbi:MAG TPA: hypothetical protein VFJ02_07515, partial [Vicinamibacterales bacterium]|nr:hypothetical protein [Vicinamibacterales bacterium]
RRVDEYSRAGVRSADAEKPSAAVLDADGDSWSRPRRITEEPATVDAVLPPLTVRMPQVVDSANSRSAGEDSGRDTDVAGATAEVSAAMAQNTSVPQEIVQTDFSGVAALCADLARIVDTRALPSILDRAASLLDASGIILWIADPDGRELNPIFAQGYPQQLVNRLGTIPRDAENATAAAFRTALLQTVMADQISPGAIAAPLVTSGGCVGVMAAEVRHDAERQDMKLAAATIVAAQLATLVGPPAAKNHTKTNAAGA